MKLGSSAFWTHLKDSVHPSTLGVVIIYKSVDSHIGEEIIDTVRRQLGDLPAERTDHVIEIQVGQIIVLETFPTEGVSA